MVQRSPVLVTNQKPKTVLDLKGFIEKSPWVGEYAVISALIYGDPGMGKTPLVGSVVEVESMCPALLIDCDSGTLSVRDRDSLQTIHLPLLANQLAAKLNTQVSDWKAIEYIYSFLRFGDHDFKTVILDGGTDIQRACELDCIEYSMDKVSRDRDPELSEIGDYRRVYERLKRMYMRFRDIKTAKGGRLNLIATAHEEIRKVDMTGQVVIIPSFFGKGAFMVSSVFDLVLRLTTKQEKNSNKVTKLLVTCLEGRTRARDRSWSLPSSIEDPTFRKIIDGIQKGKA